MVATLIGFANCVTIYCARRSMVAYYIAVVGYSDNHAYITFSGQEASAATAAVTVVATVRGYAGSAVRGVIGICGCVCWSWIFLFFRLTKIGSKDRFFFPEVLIGNDRECVWEKLQKGSIAVVRR